MSKRGFYETLKFICERGSVHYSEILNHDLKERVVESRATVTLIVRELVRLGLIERQVIDSRPIRTVYKPMEKGRRLLQHLQDIENLLSTHLPSLG
jgi:DNA-binding HxlR family transcriptional regulator